MQLYHKQHCTIDQRNRLVAISINHQLILDRHLPGRSSHVFFTRKNCLPLNFCYSGTTTILRPSHDGGTLVIRPSATQRPYYSQRPAVTTSTTEKPSTVVSDLVASESISSGWTTHSLTTQWQVTTQPNFITKPRPSPWDKTTQIKLKPSKKPILADRPGSTIYKPKPQVCSFNWF